jgi:Plasmid pRiA4b ORF-3-like protein
MDVCAIKVTLLGAEPPIWRRFLVEREITLRHLHKTLQVVMGWSDSHLHQFVFQRRKVSEGILLSSLFARAGAKLLYEYDFGDGWQHELLLEEIMTGDESFRPICVAGKGNCPPEDCGGPYGYAELLEALRDPRHPEHSWYQDWLGQDFDPNYFSVEDINQRLARKRASTKGNKKFRH